MTKTSTLWEMGLLALQYLRGRKLRTVLTTLAIVFVVGLIFCINLILPSVTDGFKRMLGSTAGTSDLSITSATGESFDPVGALKIAAGVPNVQAVAGVLRRQITLPEVGVSGSVGSAAQIEIVGVDPTTIEKVRTVAVSDGRFLTSDDTGKALLPATITDIAPQMKVGFTFPLITVGGLKLYTVVGLTADKLSSSAPQFLMTLRDAGAAFNQPGLINTIEEALHAGADKDAVSTDLQKALGAGFKINSTSSSLDSYLTILQTAMSVLDLLGLFALFMGGFLIFNTFRTVVIERRHDLGMLRALGAQRGQLTQMILIEGLIQGLIGTALGLIAGYGLALLGSLAAARLVGGFVKGLDFQLQLNAQAVILSIVLGLLTTLVAVYFPAWAASRTSPLEALRPASLLDVRRAARWG